MKADLANSWIMMAIVPNVVTGEMVDKYVACLLGDEMATDHEFDGLMVKGYHWPVLLEGSQGRQCVRVAPQEGRKGRAGCLRIPR